jgi:hypothetical protein
MHQWSGMVSGKTERREKLHTGGKTKDGKKDGQKKRRKKKTEKLLLARVGRAVGTVWARYRPRY